MNTTREETMRGHRLKKYRVEIWPAHEIGVQITMETSVKESVCRKKWNVWRTQMIWAHQAETVEHYSLSWCARNNPYSWAESKET